METLIGDWVGKTVTVALRVGGGFPSKVDGRLVKVNEAGLLLEVAKTGLTFVPTGAILHVSPARSG